MNEPTFQDVIPPQKKSIRDVPIPDGRRRTVSTEKNTDIFFREPLPRRRSGRFLWWILSVVVILAVMFGALSFLSGAKISIIPKRSTVNVSMEILALRDANVGNTDIVYETISVNEEEFFIVPSDGEENVEQKASGKITIFNVFDDKNQELVANTRFKTPDGLIFRIKDPVTVPGMRTVSGEKIPGSVEVTVFADGAGEKYNIPPTRFTIPGFDGSVRAAGFYAESKSEMSGGFVGRRRVVSPQSLELASNKLKENLETSLRKSILEEVSDEYVLFEDGFFFSYGNIGQSDADDSAVKLTQKAVLTAVVFDKYELSSFIGNRLANTGNNPVLITNIPELSLTILKKDEFSKNVGVSNAGISINGSANIEWIVNIPLLAEKLAGQSMKSIEEIFRGFPAIERATPKISPFWKQTFPKNPEKIDIEIQ